MKKRFTTLMTTLILSVFFAMLSYGQGVDKTIDGLSYMVNYDEETVTLVKGDPSISGDIEIPGKINIWNKEMKVTVIYRLAFNDCEKITSIKLPYTITTIKEAAFRNCSELKSIEIPESVTTIETDELFSGCNKLTSFTIPECVTTIGTYMFQYCTSLTSIIIPNSVTNIEFGAFVNCSSLESITLPNKLETIGDYGLAGCNFKSIELPLSLTKIGMDCFEGCALESITIPDNLERIPDYAFANCEKLKTISFGNSLKSIREYAFYHCSNIENTYCFAEEIPSTHYTAFSSQGVENATLYVPASAIDAYKTTVPWSYFGTILPMSATDIKSVKTRGIAIQSAGGFINISGLDNNEKVDFYGVDGKALGSAKSIDGSVSFSAKQGTVVVAKIGKESVKIAVE